MNNLALADVVEQCALLLEYKDGASISTSELHRLVERIRYLEVPLEIFSSVNLEDRIDVLEFDNMLGFWFGDFSDDAVWNVREAILTGTSPLLERLLRETPPEAVELLRIKSLPVGLVDVVCARFGCGGVEKLKKACASKAFSNSRELTEEVEKAILCDITKLQAQRNCGDSESVSDTESLLIFEESFSRIDSPQTMFLANADALADAVICELQKELQTSNAILGGGSVVKEKVEDAYEQVCGAFGKIRRFFTSRSAPRYRRLRYEEEERRRSLDERRAAGALKSSRSARINAPLELMKVGALGRGEAAMSRLDFMIRTSDVEAAFERVKRSPFVQEIISTEGRRLSIKLNPDFFTLPYNGRPTPTATLNFYAVSDFAFGVKEVLFTSSRDHWEALRARASQKGWRLTSLGLYNGVVRLSSRSSKRLYEKLGFPLVPTELRQGIAEKTWLSNGMPELVKVEDLRSDLHMHTTFSDGLNGIDEMVDACRRRGYEYIALTDHTKNASVANGMTDSEIMHYWDVIDDYNENLRSHGDAFQILKGAEVDILENGGLDLADETLARADWIIASIHFGKRQPRRQIHRRYLDAFQNPYVDVIAHPTQRVIGVDAPMDVDVEFLCENAKRYGKCLELNSQPRRLDLDAKWLKLAKDYGVPIVISTDSHSVDHLDYIRFGVRQARRAGLSCEDVFNTLPYYQLVERRKELRSKRQA